MPGDLQTFLTKIEVGTLPKYPELSPCWYWTAHTSMGYGTLGEKTWGEKYAHRWSYKHHHGPLPEGHEVRHKCDERACVNPDHLESGTHLENVYDMLKRNETAFRRCVTNETAKLIIERRKAGVKLKQLSEDFKISTRTVGRITRGESKYISLLNAV
jgi:hypothetical protein